MTVVSSLCTTHTTSDSDSGSPLYMSPFSWIQITVLGYLRRTWLFLSSLPAKIILAMLVPCYCPTCTWDGQKLLYSTPSRQSHHRKIHGKLIDWPFTDEFNHQYGQAASSAHPGASANSSNNATTAVNPESDDLMADLDMSMASIHLDNDDSESCYGPTWWELRSVNSDPRW